MADPSWRPLAGGVAQRRRERRVRLWFRHEQQTVRMALATYSHHSAPRRQTKARAGEEVHEQYYAPRRQKPPLPQPELFSLEEEPGHVVGGSWRACTVGCRFLIFLCRRWWTTCWMPCGFWSARWPCRLSKCPRFSWMSFLLVPWFLSRSRRNSWWKCRPCCLLRASLCRSPVDTPVPQGRGGQSACSRFSPRTEFNSDVFFSETHF